MKLYHNPLSPNARRVLLTAAYLGLRLDEQVLDVANGEHKSPDYLALNPNGMIPTLVDGPLTLWESRAIIQYLASKKPESGLLGRNEADLAVCRLEGATLPTEYGPARLRWAADVCTADRHDREARPPPEQAVVADVGRPA